MVTNFVLQYPNEAIRTDLENQMSQTTITLDGEGVQTLQDFDLEISVYAKINISPQAAGRKVTSKAF